MRLGSYWVRIGFVWVRLGSFFWGAKLVFRCKPLLQKRLGLIFGRFEIGFVLGSNWVRMGSFFSG